MVNLHNTNFLEATMYEFINLDAFTEYLFDRQDQARKSARIMQAILEARSPRLSDISQRMLGKPVANYKEIQRFLDQADPKAALIRLFHEEAPFVIGDPTDCEAERQQAKRTAYVGTLSDGKTRGFWLLLLATPYRGRAIPCGFVTYSSSTIGQEATSRNLEHNRAFAQIKALLGERPLVLDREFSYLGLLENLVAEKINFVIRLKLGKPQVIFTNANQRRIKPTIKQDGRLKVYHQLYYKVPINLVGLWRPGFKQPLWVKTNLEPERGMKIYQMRAKIEQSFRDLKSRLCLDKLMNKTRSKMEQMVAMVLLAYTIGLLVGESIRDHLYGKPETKRQGSRGRGKSWYLYSGLFILLKQKIQIGIEALQKLIGQVQRSFAALVWGDVRTNV
jgi:hypothetical protein